MSKIWYEPKITELQNKIEVLLQEKVKEGLDENKVYARTIATEVLKLFKEYELKMVIYFSIPMAIILAFLFISVLGI